jgi:hypothetical protein
MSDFRRAGLRCEILTWQAPAAGAGNDPVRYLGDGSVTVIPFRRRLRRDISDDEIA